jgi:MlaA lipoprotein
MILAVPFQTRSMMEGSPALTGGHEISRLGLDQAVDYILQLRFDGAGRELARFAINSTIGIAGFFDGAHTALDIAQSDGILG